MTDQPPPPPSPADHDRAERVPDSDTLRVLDANANRASEGLRVVEEYARFALDDGHLARCLKAIRHELEAQLAILPARQRLACRDTGSDVGTSIRGPREMRRESPRDVVHANLHRTRQALRCLEEYGKILDEKFAAEIEQLRYRLYVLEKALRVTDETRLSDRARLYVLIDGADGEEPFRSRCETLVRSGVDVIQLRDKSLEDRELLGRARVLSRIARPRGTLLIVNDRPDLAVLCDADGVHCGQDELTVHDARRIVGPDRLIGISTHSLEQARQAVLDGADYIGCGPVFPSGTKRFETFPGPSLLREVSAEIRLPAFAVGGITPDNVAEIRSTGFRRVAVGQAIWRSPDIAESVRRFREELDRST